VAGVLTFEEAIAESKGDRRSVLLGNGFSLAQGGGNFSYSNLLERCRLGDDSPIRNVFRVMDTFDFEEVMNALEHAAKIANAYGDDDRAACLLEDAAEVREAVIRAVHAVHPGVQFDIPDAQRTSCAAFLNHFFSIFTLNYDLLLYWVILMTQPSVHRDGFGLGETVAGFRTFQVNPQLETYYLHGALHLFLTETLETQKRVLTDVTIIDDIASTIRERRQLPLIVAEGSSSKKLARIRSVPYLQLCYERLAALSGSFFVFSHSASDGDRHIYDQVFRSAIGKMFLCLHRPDEQLADFREKMAPYKERRQNIEVIYVDAAGAAVWRR
jgi:hypothetical protein